MKSISRPLPIHSASVWIISFAVWTFVALAASISIWQSSGTYWTFLTVLGLQCSQIIAYAPLTPCVLAMAGRYPFRRGNWLRRTLLYLAVGVLFSMAHVGLRALTHPVWIVDEQRWESAVWNSKAHKVQVRWRTLKSLFYRNLVDDVTGTFVPIVIVAHAWLYYRGWRERETREIQLEGQLAKARLQVLRSQIQPHFFFNTLHSISALMLTDVKAADKMMTRLSDLLRMSLDINGAEYATLNWELEFVTGYLEIENLRFENLKIAFNIAPETLDAQVPHLLLQPLVENAVRHGIARRSSGGEIRIDSRREGSTLHLQVRDNGPGVEWSMPSHASAGLGMKATQERLQTLYGNDQHLAIYSIPEGGVEVSVRIPFRVKSASGSQVLAQSPEMRW